MPKAALAAATLASQPKGGAALHEVAIASRSLVAGVTAGGMYYDWRIYVVLALAVIGFGHLLLNATTPFKIMFQKMKKFSKGGAMVPAGAATNDVGCQTPAENIRLCRVCESLTDYTNLGRHVDPQSMRIKLAPIYLTKEGIRTCVYHTDEVCVRAHGGNSLFAARRCTQCPRD